ncbi:hypothetical protein D3C80_1103840 [compost metagenome]
MLQLVVEVQTYLVEVVEMVLQLLLQQEELLLILTHGLRQVELQLRLQDYQQELIL